MDPQNHGFQYKKGLMTWMIWGTPMTQETSIWGISLFGEEKNIMFVDLGLQSHEILHMMLTLW